MPNTEQEGCPPDVLPQSISISSVNTSGNEIKFTLKTRVNDGKNGKSGKPDRSSKSMLYKVCCGNIIPTTDFRN